MIDRRDILKSALVLAAGQLGFGSARALPAATVGSGSAQPFDFAWVKGQARWPGGVDQARL